MVNRWNCSLGLARVPLSKIICLKFYGGIHVFLPHLLNNYTYLLEHGFLFQFSFNPSFPKCNCSQSIWFTYFLFCHAIYYDHSLSVPRIAQTFYPCQDNTFERSYLQFSYNTAFRAPWSRIFSFNKRSEKNIRSKTFCLWKKWRTLKKIRAVNSEPSQHTSNFYWKIYRNRSYERTIEKLKKQMNDYV